jgi:hypothetical protein
MVKYFAFSLLSILSLLFIKPKLLSYYYRKTSFFRTFIYCNILSLLIKISIQITHHYSMSATAFKAIESWLVLYFFFLKNAISFSI